MANDAKTVFVGAGEGKKDLEEEVPLQTPETGCEEIQEVKGWLTFYVQDKFSWNTHNIMWGFVRHVEELEERIKALEDGTS